MPSETPWYGWVLNHILTPLGEWLITPAGAVFVAALAVVGLVFSMPSLLQAIWGRPNVVVELVPRPGDLGSELGGRLSTTPVKSTVLRLLGVAKPNIPLLMFSEISHFGSRDYIYTQQAHRTGTRDGNGFHSTIGPEPVIFMVGETRDDKRVVCIKHGPNGSVDTWGQLQYGRYLFSGRVRYCVDYVMTFEAVFIINDKGFLWVPDSLKITRRK